MSEPEPKHREVNRVRRPREGAQLGGPAMLTAIRCSCQWQTHFGSRSTAQTAMKRHRREANRATTGEDSTP